MDAGNEKQWDAIVESARRRASTTESKRSSRAAWLGVCREPQPRHLPGRPRTVLLIDPTLAAAIRSLTAAEAPWPLFVHGPAGVGKTCSGLVLLDHAGGLYFTAGRLWRSVIDAQHGRYHWREPDGRSGTLWEQGFWDWLSKAPLVVLDELGSRENVSDHHYECVCRCLDEREGKPLVVLSNLDLPAVGRVYDDRVASRLAAGTVVRLEGADRRLERDGR